MLQCRKEKHRLEVIRYNGKLSDNMKITKVRTYERKGRNAQKSAPPRQADTKRPPKSTGCGRLSTLFVHICKSNKRAEKGLIHELIHIIHIFDRKRREKNVRRQKNNRFVETDKVGDFTKNTHEMIDKAEM